jgi:subtilase family serine protease
VKAASNPSSSSYGKYLTLSKLASRYGASSSKRKAVVNAFKQHDVKATVDVTVAALLGARRSKPRAAIIRSG